MTKKIFRSIFLVAIVVLLVSLVLLMGFLYQYFSDRLESELENEAVYIAQGIHHSGLAYFEGFDDRNNRITVIAPEGDVLYDSVADEAALENHGDRSEVREALAGGEGHSSRYSKTLSKRTVYYALLLRDGNVLRIANTQNSALLLFLTLIQPLLLLLLVAVVLSLVLSSGVARHIVRPINTLDLEHPEAGEPYEEIAPLLRRLSHQSKTIRLQMDQLQRKQREFSTITENMSEGFLVVDTRMEILSHNHSALHLLGAAGGVAERQNVLTLNRSSGFRRAVELALEGKRNEQSLPVNGRSYRIMANPVYHESVVSGAVMIILDITEQEQREALRREFSANVSHELKTPLTSISGFAEIMQNGLVRPEDVSRFAGNIYRESQRMIALVEDIIRLSQLDEESVPDAMESVDLLDTAGEVLDRLHEPAERAGLTLHFQGERAAVTGVRRILDEMLYNLCDNAVKYNRPGGQVWVRTGTTEGRAWVSVADTGIGIPAADRSRVFERFYRVDKSHSREIGGTGLGLSIVKHGAAFHGAAVELESEPGQGTTVTIRF